jgi:hypothetical protein
MTARPTAATLAACAGLIAGPLLWAVNVQAGQILPYADCAEHQRFAAMLALLSTVLVLGSAIVSWRARTGRPAAWASARSFGFVAVLGALVALIFALALLLQGIAGLVLNGCER